jgi:orotidine-5'-phosphate decarboxylase
MLSAAAEAAAGVANPPRLLAVTVLTSMDSSQLQSIGVSGAPAEQVLRLAQLAHSSAITGLVCSSNELPQLRSTFDDETLLVVPGIRPSGSSSNDQQRVATPATAIAAGASMLVIGRPITQAASPADAVAAILQEITKATTASSQPPLIRV